MNVTLSFPEQFVTRLKQESKTTGMKYSEIVRRALDLYFTKKEAPNE